MNRLLILEFLYVISGEVWYVRLKVNFIVENNNEFGDLFDFGRGVLLYV